MSRLALRDARPAIGNLLGMARCENCDAELQPQWKFCVRCGAKITASTPAPVPVDPAPIAESRADEVLEPTPRAPAAPLAPPAPKGPALQPTPAAPAIPAIPAAIRPHELTDDVEPPTGRRFDWHVLVGILVGVAGAAVIVYLIVALTSAGGSAP